MKKNRKAQVATLALLLAVAGLALVRNRTSPSAIQEPQDTVYAMLNAAKAGDVKAYLASYSGQMEAALRQTLTANYLKDSHAAIKGVAVSDPQKITDQEAKVRVEYIYQDRNEVQMVYLEKGPDGWKIARVDSDERVQTLIPYGTPVKALR
jgi:hypothetical protein